MRRLFVFVNALILMGAAVGCSHLEHTGTGGGCNCGGDGMVSGPEMMGDGVMMSSSSQGHGGVVVSGPSMSGEFMGQAQRMPQVTHPIINQEPPTQ